jgi:hypothetical protein
MRRFVLQKSHADLTHIVAAGDPPAGFADAGYGRKKEANEAADDGHRDEKFHERHPFRVIVICERHAARPFVKMMVRLGSQGVGPRELHLRG